MATRASERQETQRYYAAQAGLIAVLMGRVRGLAPMLDPEDLAQTYRTVRSAAAAVGAQSGLAAASLAADYYDDFRDGAGAAGRFVVPVVDAPTMADFERDLDEAVGEILDSVDSLVDELYLGEVMTQLMTQIEGTTATATADVGSDQIQQAVHADREARGWARVTRPGACSFCRMLALRGPVYTEESVKFRAHMPINGRGGVCKCVAEPLIGNSYEPTAQARADAALWERIYDEGFRGRDAVNEFRRRVEDRADGVRRPRPSNGRGKPATPTEVQGQRLGFDYLTPSQLAQQLDVLEALPESKYRATQIARVRSRLKALGA